MIDQNFATAAAAQSYFDDNVASGLLLLSPGGGAATLNIGLTVHTDQAGSGLYRDFIVGGAAGSGRAAANKTKVAMTPPGHPDSGGDQNPGKTFFDLKRTTRRNHRRALIVVGVAERLTICSTGDIVA